MPTICWEQNSLPGQPRCLKKVQGVSWYLEDENAAQVSMNLLNFETVLLQTIYKELYQDMEVSSTPCLFQ